MKIDRGFLERAVSKAINKGAHQAEIYYKTSKRLSAEVKSGELEAVESAITSGYSVRIIKDNKFGFSYSNDESELNSVIESAIESSNWSGSDEFLDLPDGLTPSAIEIFDPEIENIKEDTAFKMALLVEKSALEDSRIKNIRKSAVSFSTSHTAIFNSKGVAADYGSTACSAQIMAVASDNGESQIGWDYGAMRFLRELSFERVGRTAALRATRLLGAKKITPANSLVILENIVAAEFIGIFASLMSADAVQKGKSLLRGRLGQKVIAEGINIIDDGLLPGRLGSRPVDDEGVLVRKKYLIEDGVLKCLMQNTYTAKKDGIKSTGNAVRGGFTSVPSVGPTNLYIESKNKKIDLLTIMGRGLLVTEAMGLHTANPISGDFSIGVSGIWIDGGCAAYPVKEAVISGNILDLFGNIRVIGEDMEFYGNIGSPSLLIGPVDISA